MRERPPDAFYERFDLLVAQAASEGKTLPMIAAAIGVHFSRLYRWRDRIDGPSGASLAAFADYFGVTMDWLWGRENAAELSSPGEDPPDHPVDELDPDQEDGRSEPGRAAG